MDIEEFLSNLPVGDEVSENTPIRWAKALKELTQGYEMSIDFKTFPFEGDQMIVIKDIPYVSLCEHHILPFSGVVHIGYIPTGRVMGLSKFPRLVRAFSRRLQIQERMTAEIADCILNSELKPDGVMVIISGEHSCCSARGAESPTTFVTSAIRGKFEKPEVREEFMALCGLL
jgi:GTP cyclohydrolase I